MGEGDLKKLIFFVLFFSAVAFYSKDNVKTLQAIKLKDKLNFDGSLSENFYSKPCLNKFIQRDPNEGTPASEKTEVWVLYDEKYIYVSAKLYDNEADQIDQSLARRDSWIDSDWFYFYVDPYHDKRTGYYFGVNPAGSISDGVFYNDSWNTDSWDGLWEVKTQVLDDGWTVEMRIPFSQLRFNETEEMTWGVNFKREIKRKNEQSYFVMVPKNENGFVSKFAVLEGLSGIKPASRLEIFPYLVQKAQYLKHEANDPFYKSNQYPTALGADIKVGIGSNLNLDATINPDFGQVEVDPAVLNLSAFETYFPEKRPFFIEGSTIFNFGVGGSNSNWGFNFGTPDFFYSRRIGRSPQGNVSDNEFVDYPRETRILGAAKITGKIDETTSLGAISAVTEKTYATLYNNGTQTKEVIEPFTHYGVFRAQKEFNEGRQSLGLLFTSVNRNLNNTSLSDQLSNQAYSFGLDGWTFLDEEKLYVINASFLGTYTSGTQDYLVKLQKQPYRYYQRPDAQFARLDSSRTSLSGYYSRIMLNKQRGNFYINSALGIASPGLEFNDIGFQWFADRINAHLALGYRWFEEDEIFRRKEIYVAGFRSYNYDGNIISNGLWSRYWFQFKNYYQLNINASYSYGTFSPTATRGGALVKNPQEYDIFMNLSTDNRESIIAYLGGGYNADKLNGWYYNIWTEVEFKPLPQLNFRIGPEYSRMLNKVQWVDNIEDESAINTFGIRSVFADLHQNMISANIRLNWTFTPQLTLQLFVQPLFAIGNYSSFKELARPSSYDYLEYGNGKTSITYNESDEEYTINPNTDNNNSVYSISNPDFNFKSLRANLILRWEVNPGSVFYFAWSHDRVNFENPGEFDFKRDFKNLWNAEADNIFLVKFSYWLDM